MTSQRTFLLAFAWAFLIVFAVHVLDFPGSVPNFTKVSGGGTLLDALPAFTPIQTYQRLAAYGEAGRQNYSFRNVTVDVLLPLSVFPLLFLLARRALTRVPMRRVLGTLLLSLPFVYVTFDLLENAAVLGLLAHYPEHLVLLASTLPYVTMIKRAASLLAVALPMSLLTFQFVRRRAHLIESAR